jgi:hypothetical protein
MVQDHNPLLKAFLTDARGTDPEKGRIEQVDETQNIEWQTRPAPPSVRSNTDASIGIRSPSPRPRSKRQ